MQIVEVPVFNPDGSIKFTAQVNPEQAQALLQFSYNFLVAAGMTARIVSATKEPQEPIPETDPTKLN